MSTQSQSENPKSDIYDLGVIDLDPQEDTEREFEMEYDGYIARVSVSWPPGSNNAIGFNLGVQSPDEPDVEIPKHIQAFVADTGVIMPSNHPNPEYITDDNTAVNFFPLQEVPEGVNVTGEIFNGSTTNPLDLQLRVTTTSFDPRDIYGGPGGGF